MLTSGVELFLTISALLTCRVPTTAATSFPRESRSPIPFATAVSDTTEEKSSRVRCYWMKDANDATSKELTCNRRATSITCYTWSSTKHGPHVHWLRGWNTCIWIAHLSPGNSSTFDDLRDICVNNFDMSLVFSVRKIFC